MILNIIEETMRNSERRDIVITWDKNRQNSMVIPQVTLRLRSGYSQNMLRLVSGYFLARHRLLSVYSHANSTANLFTFPFFTIFLFSIFGIIF